MKKRHILTILGFLLFLIGAIAIVVNLIGLNFTLTDWVDKIIGDTAGFIFKIILTVGGLILAIAANAKDEEETYDEYFDGEKYY
jgi:TRAP-type mannitol/chloroaromatic compound transport system permease small subunit